MVLGRFAKHKKLIIFILFLLIFHAIILCLREYYYEYQTPEYWISGWKYPLGGDIIKVYPFKTLVDFILYFEYGILLILLILSPIFLIFWFTDRKTKRRKC